jgi:bacteriocin-like protein
MKIRYACIISIDLDQGFAFKRIVPRCYKINRKKTAMNNKNLMSEMVKPVNFLTIKDLPVELLELSEEELQQVVGGFVGEQDPPEEKPSEKEPPKKNPIKWTFTGNLGYNSQGFNGSVGVSWTF